MFVGHSFLAFAVAGGLARASGSPRRRALHVGLVAAAFALTPDLDILFAVPGVFSAAPIEGFWSASTLTHRAITHSLIVAVPAGILVVVGHDRSRWLPVALTGILAVLIGLFSGVVEGLVAGVFVLGLVGIVEIARRMELPSTLTVVAAVVGLGTHPFGDLFTGTPPALFWPLPVRVVPARVAPMADPTLDFFLAFGVELAAIWLGTLVAIGLATPPTVARIRRDLHPRAALGAVYVSTLWVLPAPTVDFAYPFVFSVIPVGAVGLRPRYGLDRETAASAWVTGLAAVSVAVTAYGLGYLIWGG